MFKTLAFSFLLLFLSGCIKEDKACTPVAPTAEETRINAFATSNGIVPIKHSSGIHYQIMSYGSGATPTINSEITVGYVGKFLDGTVFDQNTRIRNYLHKFIEGWQVGLQLIQKGGTIRLIIPSAYAYGCTMYGNIPPNSILYYEINLIDVR
ncbi:FKBP-type peptidyl-prolyl cis-trans isomerase [Aridibaculum aurantiacum]|uniref:FKBP-type peptidyl-prolyl cis-trans isomerase n=1 Tax=Aridibaculum aurantiacum TaxID=2810307 RepID=UPI001A963CC4|nr:FKBP-type peptidyl-prolyl cis-trans isomerase [Aridibaculum aurantiacum]